MLSTLLFDAAVLLSLCAASAIASPLSKRSINGPVIVENFPDPSVIKVGSTYHAFATNNGRQNIPYASSPDFAHWTVADGHDALPKVGGWSNGQDIWAPDVLQVVCIPISPQISRTRAHTLCYMTLYGSHEC